MWNFTFRTAVLSSAIALMSTTASATDRTLSPFDLIQSQAKITQQSQNYVNSGKVLSRAELMSLDAKLHAAYGNPTNKRGALKIWEVDNGRATNGTTSHTTIMCGIDQDGSQVFVIDARGAARGDNPRLFPKVTPKYFQSSVTNRSKAPQTQLNDWD
jgi:hypothetical protein